MVIKKRFDAIREILLQKSSELPRIAKETGVSRSTLYNIRRLDAEPSLSVLIKLDEYFK